MENLEEIYCTSSTIKQTLQHITAVHYHNGTTYLLTENQLFIYQEELYNNPERIYNIEGLNGAFKSVLYLPLLEIIFLASDTQLAFFKPKTGHLSIACTFDFIIKALEWNPFQTALVIINSLDEILLLTFDGAELQFQVEFSTSLSSEAPLPATAGWGVRDAQFKGSRLKNVKNTIQTPAKVVFMDDPPTISWRGNGEQFVVNYAKDDHRHLKLFSHNLSPLFESEQHDGLGPLVAFKNLGQIFACFAVREEQQEVIGFEKNCKIKFSFPVPEAAGQIRKLQFHPQTNMLAILSEDSDSNSSINIYVCYHTKWYLKQQLVYPPEEKVIDFLWTTVDNRALTTKMVICTIDKIEYHLFRFILSRSQCDSTVLVINGTKVHMSQFDKKLTPPGASDFTFINDKPVNKIIFHPTEPWCLLIDSTLIVKMLEFSSEMIKPCLINKATLSNLINTDQYTILNDNHDVKLVPKSDFQVNGSDFMFKLPYNESSDETECFTPVDVAIGKTIIYLSKRKFSFDNFENSYDFALFNNLDLYVNITKVCCGVTSFMVYKNFLIFTNVDSKVYFVRIDRKAVLDEEFDLSKAFSLSIDQGGKLVHCNNFLPPKIILQIPRGNLEVFSCTIMTIDLIEQLLQENKWNDVMFILRHETINSNVLIDLNPQRFIENIEFFIAATKYYNNLTSIVNDFNVNENCFNTVYKNYFRMPPKDFNKKEVIFKIIEHLIKTDSIANLKSIVAILYRHNSLKEAIKAIKDVYCINKTENSSICSQAIKYLLITVDQNELISTAFSVYDLDFVTLVYQNSTQDPRVYLPDLDRLKTMPLIAQRFHMNVKAGDLENALKYLLRNEQFNEEFVMNFIVKYNLEAAAYNTVSEFHTSFEAVTQCYAARLKHDRKYLEAAFVLKRGGFLEEALIEYIKALEWREVIALLKRLNYPEEKNMEILEEIADRLLIAKRINEAVIILEFHTRNHKKALKSLVEFKQFRQAICYIQTYTEDTSTNDLMPVLEDYLIGLIDKLEQLQTQFFEYLNRLKEVRREKTARFDLTNVDEPFDDIQSETSTTSSMRSIGSSTSSKNLRKEEKKKTNLRRGGRFEDIALMRALHMLYGEVLEFSISFHDICLIDEHFSWLFCNKIKMKLQRFKETMTRSASEIWPRDFITPPLSKDHAILALIENKEELDPAYASPPNVVMSNSAWNVRL